MKILVVDDSAIMRRIISNNLKSAGHSDLVEAGNGAEAMEKLSGIELILTDWNMPVMDGLTFVKEVRKDSNYAKVPIIMVTTGSTKRRFHTTNKSSPCRHCAKMDIGN